MATDLSSCPDASLRGSHVLKIIKYSRTFDSYCGVPRFVSSSFRAGGYTWKIGYHPTGLPRGYGDSVSLYLYLDGNEEQVAAAAAGPVKVWATFSFFDHDMKVRLFRHLPTMFTFLEPEVCPYASLKRDKLRKLLTDLGEDCFAVRVDLLVRKEPHDSPSDMGQHLGGLLSRNEHADVEFRVGGETFPAHRLLLRARSPVFKAKISMDESKITTTTVIEIDGMDPDVFRAMLNFIYTDTWPEMKHEQEAAMSQHLLVAADQYGLPRLKVMCQHKLCQHISLDSVEDILNLADKHQCAALKEACFNFIGYMATMFIAQDRLFEVQKTHNDRFDRLMSLLPTTTKDWILNAHRHDRWKRKSKSDSVKMTLVIK